MIRKVVDRFLKRSHFWRDTGFDELSELYVSNMLRSIALTIFLIFVPFYLYQQNYSPVAILALYGFFFVTRTFADIGAGFFVGRFGPKHTIILSNIMQILNASMLLTVPQYHWNILLLAIPWGIANSLFFIAYHVSFSKIKHTPKAGTELGHMQVFEKIGYMLGPIIGGVIGSVFGPEYIFITATTLLAISLWPLFLSKEPTKVHQKIEFNTLPVEKIKKDLVVYTWLAVENTISINTWPFYVAAFLLSGAVYAQLGSLSAIGVLAAVLSAKVIGRLSDTSLARPLIRINVYINSLLHLVRPFVSGVWGVMAMNVANEAVTAGYRMPFMKGVYAAADDLPGYRIVYISTLESVASIAKATVWFMLAILATVLSLKTVLLISFMIAALASLGITKERFAIYNRK